MYVCGGTASMCVPPLFQNTCWRPKREFQRKLKLCVTPNLLSEVLTISDTFPIYCIYCLLNWMGTLSLGPGEGETKLTLNILPGKCSSLLFGVCCTEMRHSCDTKQIWMNLLYNIPNFFLCFTLLVTIYYHRSAVWASWALYDGQRGPIKLSSPVWLAVRLRSKVCFDICQIMWMSYYWSKWLSVNSWTLCGQLHQINRF